MKKQLRVCRALDVLEQLWTDREDQGVTQVLILGHEPVMHNSQRPKRNGCEFVCCTALPVAARTCARKSRDSI